MRDFHEDLVSEDVAWRIYRVAFDPETRIVDEEATRIAREEARKERLDQSMSFKDYCAEHVTEAPPANLPYYGSWEDPAMVYAGSPDRYYPAGQVNPPVVMPNPLEVKIAKLERELAEARQG